MCLIPVLSEFDQSWPLIPFKKPGDQAVREPPRDVLEKDALLGWVSERFEATKFREP
jgi:hypothetical protein